MRTAGSSSVERSSDAPQLDYAPRPPWHRRKRARRMVLAVILLAMAAVAASGCSHSSAPVAVTQPTSRPADGTEAIVRAGFPAISNPRAIAISQVAGKPVEYLASHMGDRLHAALVAESNGQFAGCSIACWSTRLPENLFILRLIAEGQAKPDEVAAIVQRQLNVELERMEEFYKTYTNNDVGRFRAGVVPDRFEGEGQYHERHGRYQSHAAELERLVTALYGCAYVLANLDRLDDPEQLRRWIRIDNIRGWGSCGLDVWLIDRCMRGRANGEAALAKRWIAECNGSAIFTGEKIRRSAWDAPWSVSEPLFAAANVDSSGLRIAEVLAIPANEPMDGIKMGVLMEAFCKSARPTTAAPAAASEHALPRLPSSAPAVRQDR